MPASRISDPPVIAATEGNYRLLAASMAPMSSISEAPDTSPPSVTPAGAPNFVFGPSQALDKNGVAIGTLIASLISCSVVIVAVMLGVLGWRQWQRNQNGNYVAGGSDNEGVHASPAPRSRAERRMNTFHVDEETERFPSHLGLRKFSYEELKLVTQDFHDSQLLGSGGFASVYRGTLHREIFGHGERFGEREDMPSDRHQVVAIKRISREKEGGLRGFKAELTIISDLRHRNLVRLGGWGEDNDWLFLVYEYMPNGSLDTILYNNEKCLALDWPRRFNICSGLGSALLYLHEECSTVVLHRDIKSSNVLLDENFNAKLGDFGLSRLLNPLVSGHESSVVAGTRGYMALEIFHTSRTTKQSDVFAFGAVLAEIASGRRPLADKRVQEEADRAFLVDWMWDLQSQGRLLEAADERLRGNFNVEQMMRVMTIALVCCHPDPKSRPSIKTAMDAMHGTIPIPSIQNIPKPLSESF